MPTHTLTQTIHRPVSEVFEAVTDLAGHTEWDPTTTSARKLTDGEVGEGTRFEMGVKGFGKQEVELTEWEPDRHVRYVPHSSMMEGGHRFSFAEEGERTRVDHEIVIKAKGPWKIMTPLMGFMAKRTLRRSATALQEHLEGRN